MPEISPLLGYRYIIEVVQFDLLDFFFRQGSFQLQGLLIVSVKIVTSLMFMHKLREIHHRQVHHFKLLSWFLMKMIIVHLLKSRNIK